MSNSTQKEIATLPIAKTLNQKAKLKKPPSKITTKKITYCATLVAATILLKILGQGLQFGIFKISFVYIGWILSAIMFGPLGGAVVGFCSDVLGTFILPTGGSPLPLIVIGNTLFPFIVGIVYKYVPLKSDNVRIFIGAALAALICTLGINVLALTIITEGALFSTFFIARLPMAAMAFANATVVCLLLPVLKRMKIITR